MAAACREWAEREYAHASLGDGRRTRRLVLILAALAASPSGKLSEVFQSAKELDAAYDFVEGGPSPSMLEAAIGAASAALCVSGRVRVAVDGSSLTLASRHCAEAKGFGPIGSIKNGAFGLKVMSALAISDTGVPLGFLSQEWWARSCKKRKRQTKKQRYRERVRQPTSEKETGYWLKTIKSGAERLSAAGASGWFQLDREADAWPTLLELAGSGHWYTVRSAHDRRVASTGSDRRYLREVVAQSALLGGYALDVAPGLHRKERRARMAIHATQVTLHLHEKKNGGRNHPLVVNAVWAHEVSPVPSGEKPLDWLLLTNAPIDSDEAVCEIVDAYTMRWRIEEVHKTWKSGECNVEDNQLRSAKAVQRWATLHAVVAVRVERLKRLSREEPDRPATTELSALEIDVLRSLKRAFKKRTEVIPDGVPTIAQATRWLADLGGYTGKSSGGPPGSITIGRGLERLQFAVLGVEAHLRLQK